MQLYINAKIITGIDKPLYHYTHTAASSSEGKITPQSIYSCAEVGRRVKLLVTKAGYGRRFAKEIAFRQFTLKFGLVRKHTAYGLYSLAEMTLSFTSKWSGRTIPDELCPDIYSAALPNGGIVPCGSACGKISMLCDHQHPCPKPFFLLSLLRNTAILFFILEFSWCF